MTFPAVRFSTSDDHFALGFEPGIQALMLERAWRRTEAPVSDADWKNALELAIAASSQGRLFPPVVGPLTATEDPANLRAWHRLPTQSWISLGVSWMHRPSFPQPAPCAPLELADLLALAIQLVDDFCAEMQLRLRVVGDKPQGFIYAPGARLWFLPGGWLQPKDRCPENGSADRFLAAGLAELFAAVRSELLPGVQQDAVRDLELNLRAAGAQPGIVNPAEALQQARRQLQFPEMSPLPQAVPACPKCQACIPFNAWQCPACVYGFKSLGPYRRIDQDWLTHPELGFKRYCLVPLDQIGGRVPDLAALNAQLARTSDLRVLDSRKASVQEKGESSKREVNLLVLSSPAGNPTQDRDQLLAELVPAAQAVLKASQPATRVALAGLDWVRLIDDERGVCCTWKARIQPADEFRLWWSPQPIQTAALPSLASVSLDGSQRQHVIEVQTAQEVYVAVAIERSGRTLDLHLAGPCSARPPRISSPVPQRSSAVAAPVPAEVAAVQCACGTAVPGGRRFCPKCGKPVAAQAAAAANAASTPLGRSVGERSVEFVRQLEQSGRATRSLVRSDGSEGELVEAPAGSHPAKSWELFRQARIPDAYPRVLAQGCADGVARVLTDAFDSRWRTWLDCCRTVPNRTELFTLLPWLLREALSALDFLHTAGWTYGLLFPEHLRVDLDRKTARLAVPLTAVPLGQPAQVSSVPAGFVCPEFGQFDQPAAAHWDFYSLGILLAWGLAHRTPPESLSHTSLPELNLRIFIPDLPTGWGGLFARLLSKQPLQRFHSTAEVLQAIDRLEWSTSGPLSVRAAGALHVGVTKVQLNPRNQDRLCCAGPEGDLLQSTRQSFDGFAPSESYSLDECRLGTPLLAGVADGVSTVDSGEFAAATTCDVLAEFARHELRADVAPLEAISQLCDRANSRLGLAIQAAVESRADARRWLQAQAAPSCTVAALLVAGNAAAVASAGDSRVYLLRQGLLEQLTVDGDQLTEYLRGGLELSESLLRDDFKEIVGWVGRFANQGGRICPVEPQRISQSPGFWKTEFTVQPGDIFLLCTDGLSDFVDAGRIDLVPLLRNFPPAEACRKLVVAANDCGGLDNIGVVIVQLEAA